MSTQVEEPKQVEAPKVEGGHDDAPEDDSVVPSQRYITPQAARPTP